MIRCGWLQHLWNWNTLNCMCAKSSPPMIVRPSTSAPKCASRAPLTQGGPMSSLHCVIFISLPVGVGKIKIKTSISNHPSNEAHKSTHHPSHDFCLGPMIIMNFNLWPMCRWLSYLSSTGDPFSLVWGEGSIFPTPNPLPLDSLSKNFLNHCRKMRLSWNFRLTRRSTSIIWEHFVSVLKWLDFLYVLEVQSSKLEPCQYWVLQMSSRLFWNFPNSLILGVKLHSGDRNLS